MLRNAAARNNPPFRRFGIANSEKKYPRSGTPRLFQNPRKLFCRCIEPNRATTKLTQNIEHAQAHNQIAWVRVEFTRVGSSSVGAKNCPRSVLRRRSNTG